MRLMWYVRVRRFRYCTGMNQDPNRGQSPHNMRLMWYARVKRFRY